MNTIYITAEGDYGDAHGMDRDAIAWRCIVPTFFFTDEMWERFDAEPPTSRHELHFHFAIGAGSHRTDGTRECVTCGLTPEQLGVDRFTRDENIWQTPEQEYEEEYNYA
jgi:hypothetical protein